MGNKKKVPAKRVQMVSIKMVREKSTLYEGRKINSPTDAIELVQAFVGDLQCMDREMFLGIYLNTKNEPTAVEVISKGTLNSSVVHPREVLKSAILSNANSMIFLHNHPSGNPTPSLSDQDVTKRLVDGGKLMGISVLDHIIVGEDKHYSFKQEELL